jgi:hypothetical protein
VYFSNNRNSVNTYGTAVKFKTTKNIKLLNMGNVSTVQNLLTKAKSKTVQNSIIKAFKIANGIIRRNSKINSDIHVAKFICELGFDGYYASELSNKYGKGGKFHPEIVLCRPHEVLVVTNVNSLSGGPPPLKEKISVNNRIRSIVKSTNYSSVI